MSVIYREILVKVRQDETVSSDILSLRPCHWVACGPFNRYFTCELVSAASKGNVKFLKKGDFF